MARAKTSKSSKRPTAKQAPKPAPRPRQATPPTVTVSQSQCPRCSSTERSPYFNVREHEIVGVHEGKHYTHVVWRRTKCTNCDQTRDDKTFEFRKPATKKTKSAGSAELL